MSANNLFDGIAVIIDDEINKKNANINKILDQIKTKNIPYLVYEEIPENIPFEHWRGISFVLLDWNLKKDIGSKDTVSGVKIPEEVNASNVENNIVFLNKLKDICFVPVFIFTNEEINSVILILKNKKLYEDDKPNYIFVKNKTELTEPKKLFEEIENWLESTPSMSVLKEWEKEYHKSKTKLFHDFYEISPIWPKILWKSFNDDGANPSFELGQMISRNLYTRMAPFKFNLDIQSEDSKKEDKDEVRKVFEGERFIKKDNLHEDMIAAGDVFKDIDSDRLIYLNIRPDCDCIPDRNGKTCSDNPVYLYLIEGDMLTGGQEGKKYCNQYGHFNESESNAIVFSMIDGKTYNFIFKKFTMKEWSEIKCNRIGRLLPPYITHIQQKFSLYLQRSGLPRIPNIFTEQNDSPGNDMEVRKDTEKTLQHIMYP